MRLSSLVCAAVPLLVASLALVVRERTRAPIQPSPLPGTPRILTPPVELVRAALADIDGTYGLSTAGQRRTLDPSAALSEPTRPQWSALDAALVIADGGTSVSGTLEIELVESRLQEKLELQLDSARLSPSIVPGVRSAQLPSSVLRGHESLERPLRLHWIAVGEGRARALLVGSVRTSRGGCPLALELELERL